MRAPAREPHTLPPLLALRLHDANAPTGPVPEALLAQIRMAGNSDDPIRRMATVCRHRADWLAWCQDDRLYEKANKMLGWYNAMEYDEYADSQDFFLESLQEVHDYVSERGPMQPWLPPTTAKAYFEEVCEALRYVATGDWYDPSDDRPPFFLQYQHMGFFWDIAQKALARHPKALLRVPPDFEWFSSMAKFACVADPSLLPLAWEYDEHGNYGHILRGAVVAHADALLYANKEFLDNTEPEYYRLAIDSHAEALRYPPFSENINDGFYRVYAKRALAKHNWQAMQYVDVNSDQYVPIVVFAITLQDDLGYLEEGVYHYVFDLPGDLEEGVQQFTLDGAVAPVPEIEVLRYVQWDRLASNRIRFALARSAVDRSGEALQYLPTSLPQYDALVQAHEEKWGVDA
jgi:hypothetical protein